MVRHSEYEVKKKIQKKKQKKKYLYNKQGGKQAGTDLAESGGQMRSSYSGPSNVGVLATQDSLYLYLPLKTFTGIANSTKAKGDAVVYLSGHFERPTSTFYSRVSRVFYTGRLNASQRYMRKAGVAPCIS